MSGDKLHRISVDELREALLQACDLAESAAQVIDDEGVDDDGETPYVRRRIAWLRALAAAPLRRTRSKRK